jgi:hypothetical protein
VPWIGTSAGSRQVRWAGPNPKFCDPRTAALVGLAACQADSLPSEPAVPSGLDPRQDVAPLPDSWVRRAPMPISRTDLAAAAVGGVIYVFGGGLGDPTARVDAFYPNTTTLVPWRQRAFMPEPRGRTNGAAVIDGKIYVSGGYYPFAEDETPLKSKTLYRYILGTNSWTRLADMPRRSAGGETVAIDGKR